MFYISSLYHAITRTRMRFSKCYSAIKNMFSTRHTCRHLLAEFETQGEVTTVSKRSYTQIVSASFQHISFWPPQNFSSWLSPQPRPDRGHCIQHTVCTTPSSLVFNNFYIKLHCVTAAHYNTTKLNTKARHHHFHSANQRAFARLSTKSEDSRNGLKTFGWNSPAVLFITQAAAITPIHRGR